MQQRASLCRALLLDPPLLLMDEPFGALDAMTRDDMALELLRIWGELDLERSQRKTVLFVTHSIAEAVFLSDRVVVMSPRPGRIAADLRIDLPRPRTVELRASEAFGRLNLEIFRTLTGGQPARPCSKLHPWFMSIGWERGSPEPLFLWLARPPERLWRAALPAKSL